MWAAAKRIAHFALMVKWQLATLKWRLILLGIAALVLFLVILVVGILDKLTGVQNEQPTDVTFDTAGGLQVSDQVLQYRDLVESELTKHGLAEQTNLVLALMMQESGGRGNDPMQASESQCGRIGCITSPEESIVYGVEHFASVFERANRDVQLTLQSYNFGGGFIDYVQENGGRYSKELAISFSRMMYQRVKHTGIYRCHRPSAVQHGACYGDIEYVDAVLKYLAPVAVADGIITKELLSGLRSPLAIPLNVTSRFGWRVVFGQRDNHTGIDFSCTPSDTIHAVKSGTVIYSGNRGPYGNLVQVQHDNYITAYAHLSRLGVQTGQQIDAGQALGYCGTTGRSSGNHLHFEIKTAEWSGHINPAPVFGL
ncbi:lysozyme family protein [Exiguobacterium chiriqhucha]|uniref:lysozyme family protein n=1 Tax=Exiguobacterium chiriqhucha TaxID=1385984 RepID=UPI000AC1DF68|nr:lysozyme family protein [Exiguobacterium chiriqhucha]